MSSRICLRISVSSSSLTESSADWLLSLAILLMSSCLSITGAGVVGVVSAEASAAETSSSLERDIDSAGAEEGAASGCPLTAGGLAFGA